MGIDAVKPGLAHIADALPETGDAADVMGAGLQPVRQVIRHGLGNAVRAGATAEQGAARPGTDQDAGTLGAKEPLMPRHGNKGRAQPFIVHLQNPRRLGGVNDEGNPLLPAQAGNVIDGQDIAEHVGDVGADRKLHPGQLILKGRQHGGAVKQRSFRHMDFRPQGRQGPCDRIMLIAGDQDSGSFTGQAVDGNIQAVGGVQGKNDLLRGRDMEQLRRLHTAI